jgi:hypothetical protein
MKTFPCSRDKTGDATKRVPTGVLCAVLVVVALVLGACVRPGVRLEPGVLLTDPEGAYLVDLLWAGTDEVLPEFPKHQQREDAR